MIIVILGIPPAAALRLDLRRLRRSFPEEALRGGDEVSGRVVEIEAQKPRGLEVREPDGLRHVGQLGRASESRGLHWSTYHINLSRFCHYLPLPSSRRRMTLTQTVTATQTVTVRRRSYINKHNSCKVLR